MATQVPGWWLSKSALQHEVADRMKRYSMHASGRWTLDIGRRASRT
eukprot:CAMPEP_0177535674 /NCGR_PEP_ID=MMETSP0369-20130122/56709_1 /TAXON_ID=447022 ORGANISM="Scrippsiella hangoei-like, Strain SHHI-4" /NCGR_SAMPLE_ID=MMETSP0369 /ASSEMBLY_ACC=CAM_ASM_000364 /LENGTH=45 /DNA_ID= /DNA_START= /DNA_END= /DNA_ORIENTATION=